MIRAYWWPGPPANFGDQLMPRIVEHFTHETVVWAAPEDADMILGGSILGLIDAVRPGTPVWGAGFLAAPITARERWTGPDVSWRAVRGALSAARIDSPPSVLGDPAILTALVYPPRGHHGRHVWMPHWTDDRTMPGVPIRTWGLDPEVICEAIAGAATVTTSSLHVLVVGNAYHVPVTFLPSPGIIGRDYKLADYRSVQGDPDALLAAAPW